MMKGFSSRADVPVLGDRVVILRCLEERDAEDHLAGEDDDQIKWLSGGPGAVEHVLAWIRENRAQWKAGGPRRHFGMYDQTTGQLVGGAEANVQVSGLELGEVNLSYAVFPRWRGRGLAKRAVGLICDWLSLEARYSKAIIRIAPGNVFSHPVARSAGFVDSGSIILSDEGPLIRYERPLVPPHSI